MQEDGEDAVLGSCGKEGQEFRYRELCTIYPYGLNDNVKGVGNVSYNKAFIHQATCCSNKLPATFLEQLLVNFKGNMLPVPLTFKIADLHTLGACAAVVAILVNRRRRRRRNRTIWVREWVKNRKDQGAYHQLLQELRLTDTSSYRNFLRMDAPTVDELPHMVGPMIMYQDTVMRKAISPGERLALTLRYLATGNPLHCITPVTCTCICNLAHRGNIKKGHCQASSLKISSSLLQVSSYQHHPGTALLRVHSPSQVRHFQNSSLIKSNGIKTTTCTQFMYTYMYMYM